VLLDEYQDTSVVQSDLLATIFRGHARDGRRRSASIDLRLARCERGNLGAFARAFAPASLGADALRFSLLTSWRNSEQVLTAANAVLAARDPHPRRRR
jgi:DNA helicase-2/ATP-dependent DNA helicase PcrA